MKRISDARAIGRSATSMLFRKSGRALRAVHQHESEPLVDSLEQRQMLAIVTNPGMELPNQTFSQNGGAIVLDLAGRYNDNGITGTLVRFNTSSGFIDVELFDLAGSGRTRTTPLTVANFLSYANANRYDNTVMHRAVPGFIVQGGGFALPTTNNSAPTATPTDPAVLNEPGNTNARGTIAMAKLGGDPNSATNQWFFNLVNNADTLDNQNGGFTAFGRIINGISVPDTVAALRRFDFGSPFNELPVRASYDGQTVRPADFVNVSDISVNGDRTTVVNQSLTYTITSANPALATARLYDGRLVVAPGAGMNGSTTITVRVTGVDGQFTEDTFDVNVSATAAAEQLGVSPVPINGVGGAYTLTSGGTTFTDPGVSSVSYFLDSNRNGAFDSATDTLLGTDGSSEGGFTLAGTATGFLSGTNLVFARGTLTAGGNTAVVSQIALVNAAPTIASVSSNPAVISTAGATITLTANTVADADSGGVTGVKFYFDVDGNGMLDTAVDTLLGEDLSSAGGYSLLNVSTAAFSSSMLNRIFAIATDAEGATSVPVSTTIRLNAVPVITVFGPTFAAVRPTSATISATVTDDGNNITSVQFFRDTNGNGVFDIEADGLLGTDTTAAAGGVYSINFVTSGQALGSFTIFARAIDADGGTSAASSATLNITSTPPRVTAITRTPDPVSMVGANLTVTATGVTDVDSTIANVRFYFGPSSLMVFDIAQVTLFGEDTSSVGGFNFTGALTEALGFAPGTYRFFAVATDTDGTPTANGNVPSVLVRINAVPTIASVTSNLETVARLAPVIFTANTVADDATVTRVNFYRDVDGDGLLNTTIDRLLGSDTSATGGYTLSTTTTGYAAGINTIFATAVDNNGGVSAPVSTTITVVNATPVITSVSASPQPVSQLGNDVTLTATGQRDTDGTIAQVRFYLETNGMEGLQDTDFLLATDSLPAGGYARTVSTNSDDGWVEGANLVYAQVVDNDGATANTPAATVNVNARPSVASVTSNLNTVERLASVIFTANTVADNGTIARVNFYRDVNGDGVLNTSVDRLLGSDSSAVLGYAISTTTAGFSSGVNTIFATAVDNNGGVSAPVSTTIMVINALPIITNVTSLPRPVVQLGSNVTLTAVGQRDTDGTVSEVRFFLETNGIVGRQDDDFLLGIDNSAAGGFRIIAAANASDGWVEGNNLIYGQAVDNDTGTASTAAITVTVNPRPTITSLTTSDADNSVVRTDIVTYTANGVADSAPGTVRRVEFYRDVNGNGLIDVGTDRLLGSDASATGGYTFTISTAGFTTGNNTIMARAIDNSTAASAAATVVLAVANRAPTITSGTVRASPVPFLGQAITITANGAADPDGGISSVLFFLETNNTPGLQTAAAPGIPADQLIGEDALVAGGYTLNVATTSLRGFQVGANTVYSCVVDGEGANSAVPTTFTITATNSLPNVFSLTELPGPVDRGTRVTLSAGDIEDADVGATVRGVDFYRDRNGNGQIDVGIDQLLGRSTRAVNGLFTLANIDTRSFTTFGNIIMVRAQDNRNAYGETFTGTVGITNVAPVAPTLGVTPAVVGTLGANITLTATNVRDTEGTVGSVQFYRDNGDNIFDAATDALLGSDALAAGGYTLTIASSAMNGFSVGTVRYFARTIDNEGTAGNASASVTHRINAAPTIGGLISSPETLSRTAGYTLTAQTVTDSDSPGTNNIRSVKFYFDTNNNGILDAADRLLGSGTRTTGTFNWSISRAGSTLPTTGATVRVFAQATDTDNATNVTSVVFNIA